MSKILGIDSGTGFSAMAIFEGGAPQIITNSEGTRTTPSVVSFSKTGERLVGQPAARQAIVNAKNTAFEFKRLMGKKYSEVSDLIKKFPYEIVQSANGDCRIKIDGKEYSPEEMTSFVLAKLKADAEKYLGEKVEKAVITCPAYWGDDQRKAVKVAGQIAGLDVVRVINEPTAAALAYGLDKKKKDCIIAVADLGCGTSDFTVLEMGDGVFEVIATSGDSELGGRDYDQKIVDWLISEFKAETGIDLSADKMAMQRLKDEAENAKITLSTAETIDINLPFITADASGPKHLMKTLTRAKFESLVYDLNERYTAPVKQLISDANKKIDDLIIVGGTTRIPSVRAKIKELFGLEPSNAVNADEAIATGAAIQGAVLNGDKAVGDILLLDVTPLDLVICTNENTATTMIARNSTIPCKKSQVFSTAADNQPACTIRVAQGGRSRFSDNKILGSFNIEGIPPAPMGVPQIEVSYDIDSNGILTVSAKDLGTNKEQHITISGSSGLSQEEIDKAVKDAEDHAEEDKKFTELVTTKNIAEGLCFSLEKLIKEQSEKLNDEALVTKVKDKIKETRDAIATNDIDKIKAAYDELSKINADEVVPKIYPNQNASGMPGNGQAFSPEQFAEMMKNNPEMKAQFD